MRVRIAYGVNLEDVPSKVKNMIEEAGMNLDGKVQLIKQLVSFVEQKGGMSIASHHITQIRHSLSDLDTVLADAQAIADGKKIIARPVDKMYPMGTPEDLDYFLNKVNPYGFL